MRSVLVMLTMVLTMLAGCSDDGGGGSQVGDPGNIVVADDKGAITGLLVDDRFRPIHLVDEPQTEFQTTGFILLQELGLEAKTNENGEFVFVDLEPGTYTIRAQIAGHEATPERANVQEGEFAEVSVVARRLASEGGAIITTEYGIFTCPVDALVITYANPECLADLSGDSGRFDLQFSLSAYADVLEAMVTETLFQRDGWHDVVIRYFDDVECGEWPPLFDCMFAEANTGGGRYLKFINIPGETNDEYEPPRNVEFRTDRNIQAAVFGHPDSYGTLRPVAEIVDPYIEETGRSIRGVGIALAVKAQMLQSLFLGDAGVDVNEYCVLCEGA